MRNLILTLFALTLIVSEADAQFNNLGQEEINAVTTAVPFALIAPDSRAGALGDAGVSSSPDANSQHWNPAKYPFIDDDFGMSISYSPWLSELVDDINLLYLTGYYKINKNSAISSSLRYFSLGEIQFTGDNGEDNGTYKPNEFAIDVAYSRLLGDNFSGAVALRYIRSDLTQGQFVSGGATEAGDAVSADVAIYYTKEIDLFELDGNFAFGVNVSNIGTKMSYSETLERDFIPTNLRFGPSLTLELDKYNKVSFMIDINKLLVPTPPIYSDSTSGGDLLIEKGMDPDRSVANAMITSFYDAPGGAKEEFREFYYGAGVEYAYEEMFFLRAGYFHEHATKGNRKYVTLGAGFKYNVFTLDLSYLVPTTQRHPLANTLRFTMLFNFLNQSDAQ